jgi:hypothetical protein
MKQILFTLLFISTSSTIFAMVTSKEPTPIKREAPHVITLFIKPYEELEGLPSFQTPETKANLFIDPLYVSRRSLQEKFQYATDPRGVYVLYAGYVDRVDFNRQVAFPRLTEKDEIDIIVTRKIFPITTEFKNTVAYFSRIEKAPIAYYRMKRHVDPKNQFAYWETIKLEKPKEKNIPPSALVIFAEPDAIYIPTEKVIATPGPNLVLPPIYATEKLAKDYTALSFIKVNHYFAPIEKVTKIVPPQRYGQMIRP